MIYENVGREIGALVDKKNQAYGSSFNNSGEILRVLFPNGIKVEQYTDMLAVVRILDKLFRIANDKNAFNEDPWQDIAGYGILGTYNKRSSAELK
jgi:hypothetical protein